MIRRLFLRSCAWVYLHAAKPILFRIPPDVVHERMIAISSFIGKFPLTRWILRGMFIKRYDSLKQRYHGIDFPSPVGLSAGFDKNGEVMPAIAALNFGFGEVGSVTAMPCAGNPRPWFYRLPKTKSAVVNAGLANQGSQRILARLNRIRPSVISRFPIILSVAKTNSCEVVSEKEGIDDYVVTARRAKKSKNINAIELNISCPNTYGGEPFTDPAMLDRLLESIDKVGLKKPVFVKMPVDLKWIKFNQLLEVIVRHEIAGVTISNLFKDRSRVEILDDLPDSVKGNLSGKPTWQVSNELIKKTYQNYGDKLTIIGVGGIFTAEDAYAKIRLGASLVEIITGVLFNGPQLAAQINHDLAYFVKRDGFENIHEAVGVDAKSQS